MPDAPFETEFARHIWDTRYRDRSDGEERDRSVEDTWRRVARALAAVEPRECADWEGRFYRLLEGFRFLPGGRILAGAGIGRDVTLFNCFVMGPIGDSMEAIFEALKEGTRDPVPCAVMREVPARALWDRIMAAAYERPRSLASSSWTA
jgi:ribonucleoside-diphosphate reductase alpha chain